MMMALVRRLFLALLTLSMLVFAALFADPRPIDKSSDQKSARKSAKPAIAQKSDQKNELIEMREPLPSPTPGATLEESALEKSALIEKLQTEADKLYATDDPQADQRLKRLAEDLNLSSARELKRVALDSEKPQSARFLAVYLLGLRAAEFSTELFEIALTDASILETNFNAEVSVRIQAMAALDSLTGTDQARVQKMFEQIEGRQSNSLLQKVARLGVRGSKQGNPIIQKYIDMELSEIMDESH